VNQTHLASLESFTAGEKKLQKTLALKCSVVPSIPLNMNRAFLKRFESPVSRGGRVSGVGNNAHAPPFFSEIFSADFFPISRK
jgi:hypothetical protein